MSADLFLHVIQVLHAMTACDANDGLMAHLPSTGLKR